MAVSYGTTLPLTLWGRRKCPWQSSQGCSSCSEWVGARASELQSSTVHSQSLSWLREGPPCRLLLAEKCAPSIIAAHYQVAEVTTVFS